MNTDIKNTAETMKAIEDALAAHLVLCRLKAWLGKNQLEFVAQAREQALTHDTEAYAAAYELCCCANLYAGVANKIAELEAQVKPGPEVRPIFVDGRFVDPKTMEEIKPSPTPEEKP